MRLHSVSRRGTIASGVMDRAAANMDVYLAHLQTTDFIPFIAAAPAREPRDFIWVAMAICVGSVIWLTLRSFRRRDPLETKPFRIGLAQQKTIERDMQNVLVELSDMTRVLSSQLDTRAAKLQALIDDADRRIELLTQLQGQAGQTRPASSFDSAVVPADGSGNLRITDDDLSAVGVSPDLLSAQPSRSRPTMRISNMQTDSADPHAEIYELARQGLDARAIAQRLHRPAGEIELILALRSRLDDAGEPPAIASA